MAAPGYKPLDVGQPTAVPLQGILGADFNTPAIDWTDEQKIQAQLLAQQLANQQAQAIDPLLVQRQQIANQSGQLTLNDQQQKADYETALKQAIDQERQNQLDTKLQAIDQVRQANNLGPNEGPLAAPTLEDQSIDPGKANQIAEKLAYEKGDISQALEIEKARRNTSGDRPLTQSEIDDMAAQGYNLSPGSTLSDARLAVAMKNSGLRQTDIGNKQDRFNQHLDYTKNKDQAPGIFDAQLNQDGTPKPISAKQQDNLTGLQTGLDTVVRNGDALIQHLQDDRLSIGDKLLIQKQEIANMLPALRQLDHQGVRFNEFIKGIDISQIGDDAELTDRIVGSFTGQDPAAAVDRFIREVVKQTQSQVNANNATISPEKTAAFDPGLPVYYQHYGVFDRGQLPSSPGSGTTSKGSIKIPDLSGQGSASSASGGGSLPRNADGSPLTKEQFQKWQSEH